MEFRGWRITVLLVIAQLIVLATATRLSDDVALPKPDGKIPVPSDNSTEGALNSTNAARKENLEGEADKSNKTESFMSKLEHIACSSVGLLCPKDQNKTEAAADDNKTKVEPTELSKEKGRDEKEKGKSSTLAGADKENEKVGRSSSSSSNSSPDDKKI